MTPTSVVLTFITLFLLIALQKISKVWVASVLGTFHTKFLTRWLKFERRDIPTPTFTQKSEISQAYFFPRKETELCATVTACSQVREHFGGYVLGKCTNVNV